MNPDSIKSYATESELKSSCEHGYRLSVPLHVGGANDLVEEQVERILSRLKPAMKKLLVIKRLLPYLQKWHVLLESEEEHLRATVYEPSEQVGAKVT